MSTFATPLGTSRRDVIRWTVCFTVVLAIYGSVAMALIHRVSEDSDFGVDAPVVMLDLPESLAASPAPAKDLPPGPLEETESEPMPPPKEDVKPPEPEADLAIPMPEKPLPEPMITTPSRGRISGRVYDERGKPVPGAKVRLAVGGESGGKAVSAVTDRSGAFTLRGVRPGSSYTVIAVACAQVTARSHSAWPRSVRWASVP